MLIGRIQSPVFGHLPLGKTDDANFREEFVINGQQLTDAIVERKMRARGDIYILYSQFFGRGQLVL